ncbi:MAG: bacillithiol biosynthesis deacetylase BshB1 [Candidatus Sumerlaeia bacterium]|nr:bacillithiol biosynthesis deacetylase BshB1 [Candidatus Sumerlaeia bacterium]
MTRRDAAALFIGAHPDDCELLAGALIARLADAGHRVVLADATAGEMGTRGTPQERALEAAEAARILGAERVCLGLPDGRIAHDRAESVRAIVHAIRQHRPRLVFTHSPGDHHPDHNALSAFVKEACFLANAGRYDTGQERHRVERYFYFWGHRDLPPANLAFIADATPYWDRKLDSVRAHRSQVHTPGYDGPATTLSDGGFWQRLEARFAYFGSLVGVRYGEPFTADQALRVDDPLALPGAGA